MFWGYIDKKDTVNCEYSVVKIFSDSLAYVKIECTKLMICALLMVMWYGVVCPKLFNMKKFIAQTIFTTKYLRYLRQCCLYFGRLYSSNDAPFGEYGVSNVTLTAVTSGQLISRTLNFDMTRSGGNLGTTQVTVNITYDQVREHCHFCSHSVLMIIVIYYS